MILSDPTPEEIKESVDAAFDSVNLINQESVSAKTDFIISTVKRNYEHLEIMMTKTWFSSALTPQQTIDINNAIQLGITYCS
jgi:hypothetical protein